MKRFSKAMAMAIAVIALLGLSSQATVPQTINYQGRLTDAAGDPVADAAYLVKFIIYDAAVAGADLWNSGFQNVTTVDGLFNFEMGSSVVFPSNLFADTVRWLGITIGADTELAPRTKITSHAFVMEAVNSDTAGIAVTVFDNSITGAKIVAGTITASDLAANSVGSSEIAANAVGSSEIAPNAVGQTEIATNGVASSEVLDNSLTAVDLAANSVGASEIAANAVGASEIATNAVGASEIAASAVGSSEVQNNSLLDIDMGDEAGVTQELNSGTITTSFDVATIIDTKTINCPTTGFILAIYSAEFGAFHTNGTTSGCALWLSNSGTSISGGLLKNVTWPSGMPTGTFNVIVSLNYIFAVPAGNTTINLVADKTAPAPSYTFDDRALSLVFFPTAYTTLTSPPTPPGENERELEQSSR